MGCYFSICVDLVFRKEAEPYKGTGPCRDRWQTDCQVKTVSSKGDKYRLNICWQVQLLFCTFRNTQPSIPSSVFRDKPSNANRSFIHSFIHSGLLRTFLYRVLSRPHRSTNMRPATERVMIGKRAALRCVEELDRIMNQGWIIKARMAQSSKTL